MLPLLVLLTSLFGLVYSFQLPLTPSDSSRSNSILTPEFTSFVNSLRAEYDVPGVAVTVISPRGGIEVGAWGVVDEEATETTIDHLFAIASNSKAFTSTAIGMLVENGTFGEAGWRAKVGDVLGEDAFRLRDEVASDRATLVDILSHRSGMPRHDFSYTGNETLEDIVHKLRYLAPSSEFREGWAYNNMMYMTAAILVRKLSGVPLPVFVQRHILVRLGMTSTTYDARDQRMSQAFRKAADGSTRRVPHALAEVDAEAGETNAGAGGVHSSARDMAIWLQTLLARGHHPYTNATVIPASVYDAVTGSVGVPSPKGPDDEPELSLQTYGMGFFRQAYRAHEMVWHSGSVPGFVSVVAHLPRDGVALAVMTNADERDVYRILQYRLLDDALGLPRIDWHSRLRNGSAFEKSTASSAARVSTSLVTDIDPASLSGTYQNAAYGSITLCSTSSNLPPCLSVLSTFSVFSPPTNSSLYAAWPRLFGTHLHARCDLNDSLQGNISFVELFPEGFGENASAFSLGGMVEEGAAVEFNVDGEGKVRGMGWNGIWGAGQIEDRPKGEGVEGRSEVWFDKV